jgi:hypothetical protein
MTGNSENRVIRNEQAICRVIDGEVVVLLPEDATLHALTGCGSRVWEIIDGGATIFEIAQKICEEYEVEPETAIKDITEFIRKLANMNLVQIVSVVSEGANR